MPPRLLLILQLIEQLPGAKDDAFAVELDDALGPPRWPLCLGL